MGAWIGSVELAHPDRDGPEGERAWVFSYTGSARAKPGSPPMTSRTASGAKLLDGLESKHHCKSGVSLPRGRMHRHHD